MIPIFLDPFKVRVGVVGRGQICVRRLAWLRGLGASPTVFSDEPSEELRARAGSALVGRLPQEGDLVRLAALWIVDVDVVAERRLAEAVRLSGILVNVEDAKGHCDFHTPAVVRRGKLVLAAGTGGASPAAAAIVRERLEEVFPEEWAEALDEVARARIALRKAGARLEDLNTDARRRLRARALIS